MSRMPKTWKPSRIYFPVLKQSVELVLAFCELEDHINDLQIPSEPCKEEDWKWNDVKAKACILDFT